MTSRFLALSYSVLFQAKKMNVKSLSSNQDAAQKSVEIRIAKVFITFSYTTTISVSVGLLHINKKDDMWFSTDYIRTD